MPIELAALATTVVSSFLLPYAKAGLEKIAEGLAEQVSPELAKYASELSSKVWELVKAAFSSPKEQTTLELFQENPDDMQAMLIKTLQKKLEQDNQLAQTLSDLINQPSPDGTSTGAQIMKAGIAGLVDLRGADLSEAKQLRIAGS